MTYRLIGDIGGTNARFAVIAPGSNVPEQELTLACDDFPDLAAAITGYYAQIGLETQPEYAAVALATALDGDHVEFTNNHWQFSIAATQTSLNLKKLTLLNDFTALALSLRHLTSEHLVKVGGDESVDDAPIALIGAGTGLGVSGLVPFEGHWQPLNTEGGHCTIATATQREHDIVAEIGKSFDHVSSERLLCGPGLVNIYNAICAIDGKQAASVTPKDITTNSRCDVCVETVSVFCELLGTAASNLTISLGARGGVFIGGGIVPKLGERFYTSGFRKRFDAKGRFSDYMSGIPCHVITHPTPALVGLAAEVNALI